VSKYLDAVTMSWAEATSGRKNRNTAATRDKKEPSDEMYRKCDGSSRLDVPNVLAKGRGCG
jgi:hypothetical protein